MAMSRSRAPASLSTLARSIGSMAPARNQRCVDGHAGRWRRCVVGSPFLLLGFAYPFSTGKAMAEGTDCAAIALLRSESDGCALTSDRLEPVAARSIITGPKLLRRRDHAFASVTDRGGMARPGGIDWHRYRLATSNSRSCAAHHTEARGQMNRPMRTEDLLSRESLHEELLPPGSARDRLRYSASWYFPRVICRSRLPARANRQPNSPSVWPHLRSLLRPRAIGVLNPRSK